MRFQSNQIIFVFLSTLHILFSFFVNPVGYVTGDSGEYHYMVRNFVKNGSFYIDNGYDIYPSRALMVAQLVAPNGKLVAKSPELYTLLMAPAYALLGFRGVFMMNSFMFVGVCYLIFKISRLLYADIETGSWAVGIYSFCTYAWEYSQSSYPHIPATFFILISFYCIMRWLHINETNKALPWIFYAGLSIGCAIGMRLDSVLAIPTLLLPIIMRRNGSKFLEHFLFLVGFLPFAIFLLFSNWIKFGSFNIFSYGEAGYRHLIKYFPIFLMLSAGIIILCFRQSIGKLYYRFSTHGRLFIGVAGLIIILIFSPIIKRIMSGIFLIIINAGSLEPLSSGNKAALLQSCPYMIGLICLRYTFLQGGLNKRERIYLFTTPVMFAIFYGYFSWHGSQTLLNMRYLNPALPFFALLIAPIWRGLIKNLKIKNIRIILAYFGLFLVWLLVWNFLICNKNAIEGFLVAVLPAILSTIIGIFAISSQTFLYSSRSKIFLLFLILATSWASGMMVARDYVNSAAMRIHTQNVAGELRPFLKPNTTVISNGSGLMATWLMPEYFSGFVSAKLLIENSFDEFIGNLIQSHLTKNRNVYFLINKEDEKKLFLQKNFFSEYTIFLEHSVKNNKEENYLFLYRILKR